MNEFTDSTPTDVVKCPMVPIRDVVVFPYTMVAFVIGRPASVRALEAALRSDKTIFLATQHDARRGGRRLLAGDLEKSATDGGAAITIEFTYWPGWLAG